ncbi:MAG: response regulator [Bacteroidetes bacterium]|nr:response regulator [Bacteroidota bacterium]
MRIKKTILAIDDSKAIRFLLQTILSGEYDVITMPDGCSAKYWLSRKKLPDLIIADPQLPDMKDWELVKHFSSSIIYSHIPMLILSGLDPQETRQRCFELGIQKYFMKPFNPSDLLQTVNTMIKKQSFSSDYFNAN